jgi:hypothetical protein
MLRVPRVFPCLGLALLIAACGGGDGAAGSEEGPPPPPPAQMVDVSVSGQTVTKVRVAGNVVGFLEERLTSIFEQGPQRTLAILQSDRVTVRSYTPPAGWSLVDFVVHPSGDLSVVLTTTTGVRIVRLDSSGTVRSDQPFLDSAVATDPFYNYAGGVRDDEALQPVLMHDAARLVPLGEGLALVLRTGRNAVVAYRLDPDANGAYRRGWRTLVEPGSSILGQGLITGSFDVFGQLQNHVEIHVDVDAAGTLAVGVVDLPMANFTFQAHNEYFNDSITAQVGVLVTRVATSDGRRIGSTAIDTHQRAELHGLRATPRGFVLVGRVLTEVRPDGTGWDAFTALVSRDGEPGPYIVVDVDRGDVLFDIAALSDGRYVALGTTGYTQNPSGASISEAAQPLLALLSPDGSLAQHIGFTSGPRQNQLSSIASLEGRWLIGGMVNGPGTHSGDTQRELIVADGFLKTVSGLPNP